MKLIRIIVLNCAMQATVNGTNNRVSGNRWKIIRNISAISSFVATAMNLIIEMIGRSVAWWHTYDIFLNIRYCNPYSPFFAVMPHFSIPFSIVGSVFFFHRELLLAIAVPVALALNKMSYEILEWSFHKSLTMKSKNDTEQWAFWIDEFWYDYYFD